MNKDKLQVGDLVTYTDFPFRVGLVIDDEPIGGFPLRYRTYWFKSAQITRSSRKALTKLSPTQEEQNE
jgi:hypothetical protein